MSMRWRERRVIITPVEHGMAELWAYLPAEQAAAITATLDALAYATVHGKGGDPRTGDQRRADAFVDLCTAPLGDPNLTGGHGQRPAVQVTVAATTLMGLDDQPGELDGYGTITATMARYIATDPTATWRRLLTDDEGRVLHAGTTTYRPPAHMTRTVIARDVHCMFPGCRKKARHNDLDHIKRLQTRRPDHDREPDVAVPTAPPLQTRRGMDRRTRPPNRHHHLDRPQRPQLPNPTTRPTHHRGNRHGQAGTESSTATDAGRSARRNRCGSRSATVLI